MNLVLLDVVAGDASNSFDAVGFPFELNFVALHDFLNFGSNFTHTCVDARVLGNLLDDQDLQRGFRGTVKYLP